MTGAATAPAVAVDGLAVGKGSGCAFVGVSFALPAAGFTALLGPNGSGKTTLFEALLGLIKPRAGRIEVLAGNPVRARRHVAYVPQAAGLTHDGQFIGRDFVTAAYRGERWGMPLRPRAVRRAVERALAWVGAEALAERRLAALSGGQRQRLLIAQALVNQPRLVFMDEPLAQLDPSAQDEIVDLAAHLRDRHGLGVLFSTHNINPVIDTADQVLYLAGGQGRVGIAEEVITDAVLSELYGVPMHVVRERGQLFVMPDRARAGASGAAAPLARGGVAAS